MAAVSQMQIQGQSQLEAIIGLIRYGSHPHLAGITLEYPAFVITGPEQPLQNISSRVR